MNTPADEDDIRRAADFLLTPWVVEILLALRTCDSTGLLDHRGWDAAQREAVEILTSTGAVARRPAAADQSAPLRLALTRKGRYMYELVDHIVGVDLASPCSDVGHAKDRDPHVTVQ